MNTITCTFDHHDYISAVEGFAHGSHLRQHIWEMMILHHFPQMDDDFLDFAWWIFKRNLWDDYKGRFGEDDYIHALAVLHRGNRWMIHTSYEGNDEKILCYRFRKNYYPVNKDGVNRWCQRIADEYITEVEKLPHPKNAMVDTSRYNEWKDLSIYD